MQGIKSMKSKKETQKKRKCKKYAKAGVGSLHGLFTLTLCAVLALAGIIVPKVAGKSEEKKVYAAAETGEIDSSVMVDAGEYTLPSGIAGVVSGVGETPMPGMTVKRIGTSCEQVVVGQRVQTVESSARELNLSESMEMTVNDLDSKVISMAATPKLMSDTDYETLLRIVEAEAGSEDLKGRILVANVIMNRVKNEEFPNTVTDVIWEYKNGVPQFSPTYDGRISEVTVSDETKEAVKQALEGVDYSEGALFFIQKSAAESHNVSWFEKDLKKLFKHGVHEFYTYPDEKSSDKETDKKTDKKSEVVQMVKK